MFDSESLHSGLEYPAKVIREQSNDLRFIFIFIFLMKFVVKMVSINLRFKKKKCFPMTTFKPMQE